VEIKPKHLPNFSLVYSIVWIIIGIKSREMGCNMAQGVLRDFGIQSGRLFGSRLPPGVRDVDCESGRLSVALLEENQLWKNCAPLVQERLSSRFVELHVEFLRDAILDAEDSVDTAQSPGPPRELQFGESLWSAWKRFRDRALREMRRGGESFESR
jgi:hypothetical protein